MGDGERPIARSSYTMGLDLFCEYAGVCSYEATKRANYVDIARFAAVAVLACLPVLFGSVSGAHLKVLVAGAVLAGAYASARACSAIRREPPFWALKGDRRHFAFQYADAMGLDSAFGDMWESLSFGCVTELTDAGVRQSWGGFSLEAPLGQVRWVRRTENFVIAGVLDDSEALQKWWWILPPDPFEGHKPVPAVAFHVPSLEGMTADELAGHLRRRT